MTEYCKWCDTLTGDIVKEYKDGRLIWVGCRACYEIKTKVENRPEPTRLTDVGKE